jgi:indole-3-glycerol phosphate synthase/phosphoribosylanthranilate isomerase
MTDPAGVLGKIVERKRADVGARLAGRDLASLRAEAQPTERSLRAALARPGARFIMEVKRVSPSQGELRSDVDPAAMARAYSGAADAISVLTDAPYFGGSFEDLEAVRSAFDGPVLAKDFIVDPRQVPEARIHGADAVLVILAVLGDEAAAEVMAEARRLGMDVLVEAHDEAEVRRAVALGAELIGINNRDLKTLTVDLAAESGIEDRSDVERLCPHADAFLVGSSLMRAADPALAARALVFGRVKVCGLTDPADAADAAARGASFAGLVMVPNTPRAVSLNEARPIAGAVSIPLVGVFRNEKPMQVASTARALGLAAVQLHGEEDALYIRGLRSLLPEGVEIWAAGAVGREVPDPRPGAHRTLYDTKVGGRSGGTGTVFDWSRLDGREELSGAVIAGGLTAGNAAAAGRVGAYALDVGSGVEAEPGRKDPAKLHAFFEALRLPARGDRS